MIKSKKDLELYLQCEYINTLGGDKLSIIKDLLLPSSRAYILVLRCSEYFTNTTGAFHKILARFFAFKLARYQVATGITIAMNTCELGLTLYHHGSIVINSATRIGRNCCIMNNVNIGANKGSSKAPIIGDNVYIGPGAVIYGDISIADGCYIGANAVVGRSINTPCSIVAGVPGKEINKDSTCWWMYNKLNRVK